MTIWGRLESWLSWFPWYRRRARDADLARELRDHLDLEGDEQRAAGLSPEEAAHAAHRALGNTLKIEEDVRAAWGFQWLETLSQDIRYGLRQLRRSPGFTAVAILTLALGIGANTAVFSVINAVMLRMLTVRNPDQLVQVGFQGKHSGESFVGESFSYPLFEGLRQQNQVFTDISAFDYWDSLEARPADSSFASEPGKAQLVSVNFFSILGINTILGGTFAPDEDNGTGVHAVAVISYGLWTRMFARNPSVLGKKLVIGETPFTIIGVASSHFSGLSPIRAKLVVLSACELFRPLDQRAYRDPAVSSEQIARTISLFPVSGISTAALGRIAPQIMSTLWGVSASSPATELFMLRFYCELLNGKDPSEALALTKRDFLSPSRLKGWIDSHEVNPPAGVQPDSYKDPYIWAPFVLVVGIP